MGINFKSVRMAWMESLTQEERDAHFRGELPYTSEEEDKTRELLKRMRAAEMGSDDQVPVGG